MFTSTAIGQRKYIFTGDFIFNAHVNVHGGTRLVFHRFGHKGGVHVTADRGFPHRAFEQEHLIGEIQRFAVQKVDLHLTSADFVDQCIDLQILNIAIVIHIFKQIVIFVHRINRIRLATGFWSTGAAYWRAQWQIGVAVHFYQIKLHLGCHDGFPAHFGIQRQYSAQHITWRDLNR